NLTHTVNDAVRGEFEPNERREENCPRALRCTRNETLNVSNDVPYTRMNRKMLTRDSAPAVANLAPQSHVRRKGHDCLTEPAEIIGRHHYQSISEGRDLPNGRYTESHSGKPRQHRLEKAIGHSFFEAGKGENVSGTQVFPNCR